MTTENIVVSLVAPCFNEERFIESFLEDIIQLDFPKQKMELLLLDGGSTDGTRAVIQAYLEKYPFIKLLDNPHKFVPFAMNKGIKMAKGSTIIRLDVHAGYPKDYVSKLLYWLEKLQADNIGGVWKTEVRIPTPTALANAAVLQHPLGVGNAQFRLGVHQVTEVDTVPFGCYPKEIFEKYGYYDERLHRNQDIELNKRIKRLGGKIMLVPEVECTYYARESWRALWKNNFANGKWVILTAKYTNTLDALSLRHFIPLFFVLYWLLLMPLFIFTNLYLGSLSMILFLPGLLYFLAITGASLQIALKHQMLSLFPYVIISFLTLHFSYGFGSLSAINHKRGTGNGER